MDDSQLVFGAIILFGALWSLIFAWVHFRAVGKARASESWPVTTGKVVSSQVRIEESSDRDGGTTTWYNPIVAYTYTVAGTERRGSRLRFGNPRSSSRKKAEAAIAPYPAGATITVRYNPGNPEECVLETRKPGPTYLIMSAVGLVFIAIALFAFEVI